ncbi:MAG: Gfo/Idh/MocA family oxidoreductase [Ignavibacteria bacterium]
MEKTKLAVIGLGSISQVMHLPILNKIKEAELTAICDKNNSKFKNISKKYSGAKAYKDVSLLLHENPDIDGVVIATRTDDHMETAIKCIEAGKHILVEKPIGLNAVEAAKIVEAGEKNKKIVMVGMNNRFRTDAMLEKSFVRAKELGDIFYVKTGWLRSQSSNEKWFMNMEKAGGGVFVDNGIAMLDLGMWMLGFPDVKSVSAINYYHNSKTVEDSNFTLVKFKNGSTLTIEVSWSLLRNGEFFYCNVFGTNGSGSINPLRIHKKVNKQMFDMTPKNIKHNPAIFKSSYENELKYFIGSIRGTHTPISTGKEALVVMEVADAVYKSASADKEVIFK